MQRDLGAACKIARAELTVPSAPMAAIRSGARVPQKAHHGGRWFAAAVLAGVTCAGALAVEMSHVSFTPRGGIVLQGLPKTIDAPTAADAQAAAQRDGLRLPSGLPAGTQMVTLEDYASDTLAIAYNLSGEGRRDNHLLWVVVTHAAGTGAQSKPQSAVRFSIGHEHFAVHWIAGNEQVYLDAPVTMTNAEVAAMKVSMGAR